MSYAMFISHAAYCKGSQLGPLLDIMLQLQLMLENAHLEDNLLREIYTSVPYPSIEINLRSPPKNLAYYVVVSI